MSAPHLLALLVAALLVAAAAAAAGPGQAAQPAEVHNVLERFPTAQLRWEDTLGSVSRSRGIKISYNVTELRASGDWVEVSWSGVRDPQPGDLLALYTPPDAYKQHKAPVKFVNASDAEGYLRSGAGSLPLRLVNLRSDMRWVFVRGGEQPTVVTRGPVLRNANPNQPTGVHLMRTRSPSELLVQWTTRDAGQPAARYGSSPDALAFTVPASSASYGAQDMCGPPASGAGFVDPGVLHTATLSGLRPGQQYWYQVGDLGAGRWSDVFSFRAPPLPGADSTVHILTLADQGVGEVDGSFAAMEYQPAADVAALTVAEGLGGAPGGGHYSLVLHPGDLAYARGYGALWDAWLLQQQELAARVPYMVCIGNHERDVLDPSHDIPYHTIDSGGECGVPYGARFPMPTPSNHRDQPWYSFDHGNVHFAVMSTEHHFVPGSPQWAWLEGDLAAVDRSITPWVVLVGHRPVYIDADEYGDQGKQTTAIQLQQALESLLDRYGVDVAIAGHHHSYQRTCSVHGGTCYPERMRGTVHLCVGNAGADFYNNGFQQRPAWVEHEAQTTHGYARLHINATAFHIQAVDSTTGQVFDEAVLAPRQAPAAQRSTQQQASLFAQRAEALLAAA